jgi:hypothetical protein
MHLPQVHIFSAKTLQALLDLFCRSPPISCRGLVGDHDLLSASADSFADAILISGKGINLLIVSFVLRQSDE